MENPTTKKNGSIHETEFKRFATKRIIVGIMVSVVVLWVVGIILGFFEKPAGIKVAQNRNAMLRLSLPKTRSKLTPFMNR